MTDPSTAPESDSDRPSADTPDVPDEYLAFLDDYEEALHQGRVQTPHDWLAERPSVPREVLAHLEPLYLAHRATDGVPALPGFEVFEELGRGGMGVVYRGRQKGLNRIVALKVILAGAWAGAEQKERFRREAEAAAKLQHPQIVQVHEVGEAAGRPYMCLEFLPGGSLSRRLGGKPVVSRTAAAVVEGLARAMHHAHQKNIIHRDLKPANVLLAEAGDVALEKCLLKVGDFGLAKQFGVDGGQTPSGAVLGTPSYMAPEQAEEGRPVGPAADTYALGAVLYELLTGRPPFQGANVLDTLDQVRKQEPVPPSRLQPKVPRDLETVCLKCLEKEPHKRYATAQELADDLRRFLDGEPVRARRVGPAGRLWRWARREPALAAALGMAAALLVATVVIALIYASAQSRAAEEQQRIAQELRQKDVSLRESNARLAMEAGLLQCESGQVGHGLLLLAKGLRETPEDAAGLGDALRLNLAAWGRQLPFVETAPANPDRILAGGLSDDGRWLLTGSKEGPARLWDLRTGQQVGAALPHEAPVRSVAFSPDGELLLTGGRDRQAHLWKRSTGQLLRSLASPKGQVVFAVAFSADGKRLATGTGPDYFAKEGEARVWDVVSGKEVGTALPHAGPVRAVAFTPDGRRLVTGSEDGKARLWDLASGECLRAADVGGWVGSVAVSPDGHTVLVRSNERRPHLWDPRRPSALVPLPHPFQVRSLAFTPDGKLVVTGSDAGLGRGEVRLWDATTGQPVGEPQFFPGSVDALAVSRDDGTALAVNFGNPARISRVDLARCRTRALAHGLPVRGVAFHPDDGTAITGGSDAELTRGELCFWDVATGRRLHSLPEVGPVAGLAFSPDGKRFLTVPGGKVGVRVWDTATRRETGIVLPHAPFALVAAWSPDGRRVLTGGEDNVARLWDAGTGQELAPEARPHSEPVSAVAFRLDGEEFLAGSGGGEVWRRRTATGKVLDPAFRHGVAVRAVAFSPDGATVLTAGSDQVARLWDTATGGPAGPVLQHPSNLQAAGFSPDGRLIFTAGGFADQEGTARLWHRATGKPVGPALTHRGGITSAAFSADGRTLITGSSDGTARLWDAPPPPLTASAEHITLWIEVATGMELDESGITRLLDAATWGERRQRLAELGGPVRP